jgi:hypothetical protein
VWCEIKAQPVWSHSNIFDAIFMAAIFMAYALAAAGLEADMGTVANMVRALQSQVP